MKRPIGKVENVTAAILTLAAVYLHVLTLRSAGPLWRDEASTIALATLPSRQDVWNNLQFDSFPMLWEMFVRSLADTFGAMNDPAFRLVGFLIGLVLLGSLWWNARASGHKLPLVALAMFALSPSVVVWGDSLRAYGLGMALGILVCATVWTFIANGTGWRFAMLAATSVIAVHITYYNSVVLLAACTGGGCVAIRTKQWPRLFGVLAAGGIAAASMTPYLFTIRQVGLWNNVLQIPDYGLFWFAVKLGETLEPAGGWALPLWSCAVLIALFAGVRESITSNRLELTAGERNLAIYWTVVLAVGIVANFVFLKALSYLTQPWYYLTLLALTAISIDALSGVLIRRHCARIARLVGVVVVAVLTLSSGRDAVGMRMTNVDVAAESAARLGEARDLVVVSPWHVSISFARYYSGDMPWTTIPPIGVNGLHRFDLLPHALMQPDQTTNVQPVLDEVEKVLRRGGAVFWIGEVSNAKSDTTALPPAPFPANARHLSEYQGHWTGLLRNALDRHSTLSAVALPTKSKVNRLETVHLTVAHGWRD